MTSSHESVPHVQAWRRLAALLASIPLLCHAAEFDHLQVARKNVFEFTEKPAIDVDGDQVSIRFTSKDYCDVTVVVEHKDGRIVRHIASGVLGPKAPAPLKPNALKQELRWDGKDEQGHYVDDRSDLQVRVSLGLKPRFERTLFWHPKKRAGMRKVPRCVAQPEGVYVYEGAGTEYVRLFSHEGKYIRTVHPFPSDKLKDVKGLKWSTFPDGHKAPQHQGYWKSTYMLGGGGDTRSKPGSSAKAFDVRDGSIASVRERLCRLATDGSSGPHEIYGPATKLSYYPQSIAISHDKKWLYLSGFYMCINAHQLGTHLARVKWQHAVYRMAFDGNKPAEVWKGHPTKTGNSDSLFNCPSSVCVDAKGRVYVADFRNDRVQIFSPEGDLKKSLKVNGPAVLQIHHKTQELYVFSWCMALAFGYTAPPHKTKAMMRVFAPLEDAKPRREIPLPLENHEGMKRGFMGSMHFDEVPYRATLNSYTEPPTVWLGSGWPRRGTDKSLGLSRYRIEDGKRLVLLERWNDVVQKTIKRWEPPPRQRQRLYVDPRKGTLYVGEDDAAKATDYLIRIDPATGKTRMVQLPYTAEEIAIDYVGHIYLRCDRLIGRFSLESWREVPFDYGEERVFRWSSFSRGASLISVLVTPGHRPCWWHESGMSVNTKGQIVASCCNANTKGKSKSKYSPRIFPGRYRYSEIHVWDKHGKLIAEDVFKGVMDGHGTFIDPRGDIYYLAGGHRVYEKSGDYHPLSGCVMKCKPGKGRMYALRKTKSVPVPVQKVHAEKKLPVLSSGSLGKFKVEGTDWIYPGIGYIHPTAPCQCWHARFCVDVFGRVFAPETFRNQIAVLDTNGNLILHVGRYGNVDEGEPLLADDRFRTRKPRSIGGDEVALMYANYVATDSDRRLFIADAGNGRLLSVQLGHHESVCVPLK